MYDFDREPDRTWKNSDGELFYGFDSDDGKTSWYDEDGNIDSVSTTPSEIEQSINDGWY